MLAYHCLFAKECKQRQMHFQVNDVRDFMKAFS